MPIRVPDRFSCSDGTTAPSTKPVAFDDLSPEGDASWGKSPVKRDGHCDDEQCLCNFDVPDVRKNLFQYREILQKMAEVKVDPNNKSSRELLQQGVRAYICCEYNSAVQALSQATELLVKQHGDDLHESLGQVYLYYGKALLELTRSEVEPLGEAVPKTTNGGDDDDEEMEVDPVPPLQSEADEKEKEQTENSEEKASPVADSAGAGTSAGSSGDAVAGPSSGDGAGPSTSQGAQNNEPVEDEDASDLQVAWEVLELAKKIFTRKGREGQKDLAETLITLGEISLENEKYEDAVSDIMDGLNIQKTLFTEENRTLAETYYKLGVVYGTNAQIDEAMNCFEEAMNILHRKLVKLEELDNKSIDDEIEIGDIKDLIPTIEEKISDMKNYKEEMTNGLTTLLKTGKSVAVDANGSSEKSDKPEEPQAASSSTNAVNNISHLVKRKRPSDANDSEKKKRDSEDYKPVEKQVC